MMYGHLQGRYPGILDKDPYNYFALQLLARTYLKEENGEELLNVLGRILRIGPSQSVEESDFPLEKILTLINEECIKIAEEAINKGLALAEMYFFHPTRSG